MIDLLQINDDKLNQTMQLLKGQFIERGWTAKVPYIGTAHCFIDRGDGRVLHIFSATPPIISYADAHLSNDKYATYQVLKDENIIQPATIMINDNSSLDEAIAFMENYTSVVVKPLDGSHGKGITVNITDVNSLTIAIETAKRLTKGNNRVLLQQQYDHETIYDLRILCINYEFIAAILRIPARVFGDGKLTVRELVVKENSQPNRGVAYHSELATIDLAKVEEFLGEDINRIPGDGEEVSVLGVANYGAGGETIDVTDDIPEWMKEQAIKCSKRLKLAVAGVDFLVNTVPEATKNQEELEPVVIEVNKCPALMIHDRPTSGKPRNAVEKYVDYLATL